MSNQDWLPDPTIGRVIVSCTARRNGLGPRVLPPRSDALGTLAAVMVEDPADAREVFAALDQPGRIIYVDVERKQPADLMTIALEVVRAAEVRHTKPNDATVRSVDAVLTHLLGPQLADHRIGIVSMGNLGFKTALLMAERGAQVFLSDDRPERLQTSLTMIEMLLPRYTAHAPLAWDGQSVDVLLSASARRRTLDAAWADHLADGAVVLDVGIDNLTPEFIAAALQRGARIVRLDTRASGDPVPHSAPGFFEATFGTGMIAGHPVCSGGIVGERGTVVVDSFAQPTRVFGLANGVGALIPPDELTDDDRRIMAQVNQQLTGGDHA